MKIKLGYFLVLLTGLISACKDNDKSAGNLFPDPAQVYLDYKVSGEEGFDKLTILAHIRYGGKEEDGITLEEPAGLALDGEVFPADSTEMSGTFYELNKPIEGFSGKHSIVFTGQDKKEYPAEFSFEPLNLAVPLPDTLRRQEVRFSLTGVEEGDKLRILMTDTSFINDGINRVDTLKNNQVYISPEELENLANGPVQLELIKEMEKPLKLTGEGGRLRVSFAIRRMFILQD